MIYLNYITHLVLSTKYKMIFLIIFNLIIITTSIKYNNIYITDCMQGNTPIAPRPDNTMEYIHHLEYNNAFLRNRIETLERVLHAEIRQHALDNVCSNRVIYSLIQENLNLQNQLDQINNEINTAAEMIHNPQTNLTEQEHNNSNNGNVDSYQNII